MKGFLREEPLFALCGLKCGLCLMYVGEYCPGCGGGEGNQSCAKARCSLEHGRVQFCYECGEYPCGQYEGADEYDSFVPCRGRQKDFDQVQKMGIAAFMAELREKMELLSYLLAHFNDGRRKTFFVTAVYLLDIEDLREVIGNLKEQEELLKLPEKERALAAVKLLQEIADTRGISLKLKKKPPKGKGNDGQG